MRLLLVILLALGIFSAVEAAPLAQGFSQCLLDDSTIDFGAGTALNTTVISPGSVILTPTLYQPFDGSSLPGGWSALEWSAGGTATVGSGVLTLNGSRAWTTANYAAPRALEFDATFQAINFQHAGFVKDSDFTSPWEIISSFDGSGIFARSYDGTNTALGTSFGSSNRYRIEWSASSALAYVNGALAATHTGFGDLMVVLASDAAVDGNVLVIDNVILSPYAGSGNFTSRVYDAGSSSQWGTFSATGSAPAPTSLVYSVRTGDTPTPDGTWSAFIPITSGSSVGATSRYIQYRASMVTSDTLYTSTVQQVIIQCAPASAPTNTPTPTLTPSPGPSPTPGPTLTPSATSAAGPMGAPGPQIAAPISPGINCGDGLPCGRLLWSLPRLPELASPTPMPDVAFDPPDPTAAPTQIGEDLGIDAVEDNLATLGAVEATQEVIFQLNGTPVNLSESVERMEEDAVVVFTYIRSLSNIDFGKSTLMVAFLFAWFGLIAFWKAWTFIYYIISALIGVIRKVITLILDFLPL